MTEQIIAEFKPENDALIVDIGSNDGITLKSYEKNKFNLLGIEPSSTAKYAVEQGINTENEFFSYDYSTKLNSKYVVNACTSQQ